MPQLSQDEQTAFDAVPASGEVNYTDLYYDLLRTGPGGRRIAATVRSMVRRGVLTQRHERNEETGEFSLFVARPAAAPADQA